ncbi:MAG TPA: phosphonate metabolism protein/1,5-bisphosphokinase (PRPP-forming) PhnN [Burkholderiaceae bacterium]|nr:phosphonate metabolism protein/1,5-bisphosphokinase (PRPP-forming) PhnN [Burkholderiaceae bacterium]
MTRYGLYFAPAPDSPWWRAGCRWLGRDALDNTEIPQPGNGGIPHLLLAKLTSDARRYGFHATLKAPFRLNNGFTESSLLSMAQAFCAQQGPIALKDVQVRPLENFLALCAAGPEDAIGTLAAHCLDYFDLLRAPSAPEDLAKYRCQPLTGRQKALLERWGYPRVEEEFRFHMTLTDGLAHIDWQTADTVLAAANAHFAPVRRSVPLVIDALTLFREDQPGALFSIWRRFPFEAAANHSALPASGRLFYLVGASGSGKDTLLQWVRERLPASARIVFAQRTITRPAHASETHEPIDTAAFLRLAATGHFAMQWQANDLWYGVRRGIEADLKAGRDVIVNGSREYLPRLRKLFPDAQVIWVQAEATLICGRIAQRGRETGAAMHRRIERIAQFPPLQDGRVIRLDNNGPIEVAGERLLALLLRREPAGGAC